MAEGLAVGYANSVLSYLTGQGAPPAITSVHLKLHVGAPGAAGTANAAVETTRQAVTMGTPSGGVVTNTSAVQWTNVAGTETYTHVSVWDAATAGNFVSSGAITANPVTTGDTFTLPSGDVDISMGVAS